MSDKREIAEKDLEAVAGGMNIRGDVDTTTNCILDQGLTMINQNDTQSTILRMTEVTDVTEAESEIPKGFM